MSIVSLSIASLAAPVCQPLDVAEVRSLADVAQAAPDNKRFYHLASLHAYWRTTCLKDRMAAPKEVTRALSIFLKYPIGRSIVPSMLIDIGPSLVGAREGIQSAIKDQRLVDARNARRSWPFIPQGYHDAYDALRCVRAKIETGRIDRKICWSIIDRNRGVDEYLRSTHD